MAGRPSSRSTSKDSRRKRSRVSRVRSRHCHSSSPPSSATWPWAVSCAARRSASDATRRHSARARALSRIAGRPLTRSRAGSGSCPSKPIRATSMRQSTDINCEQLAWQARAPAWSAPERKHFRRCLAASAFLFVVYAIFSTGYLHPDEYFQTVEFASSKLGITATADLPWEYREQMRSWLQPALYVMVGEAAEALGLRRPLLLLLVFRLVTGVVAWSALWTLIIAGRRWIEDEDQRRHLYSIATLL